jgi:signal transduction histidine kinase
VTISADGALRLEVADDGCGLRPDQPPGVGLSAMAERAAEVGGTLTVTAAGERGTLVAAVLPLEYP